MAAGKATLAAELKSILDLKKKSQIIFPCMCVVGTGGWSAVSI